MGGMLCLARASSTAGRSSFWNSAMVAGEEGDFGAQAFVTVVEIVVGQEIVDGEATNSADLGLV